MTDQCGYSVMYHPMVMVTFHITIFST